MKLKEIDLMNTLMCFCVVFIHLSSAPVTTLPHDSIWYLIMFVFNKSLTFSVPAFIFLSGYKLFNKYKDTQMNVKEFYIGRFKKILLPFLICYLVYFFFYLYNGLAKWEDFIPGLIHGNLVAHFYYILVALQLYLLFPIIIKLFKKSERFILLLSLILSILFSHFISFSFSNILFTKYIFYFVLGMFVVNNNSFVKIKTLLIPFFIVFIIHISLSYLMSLCNFWYKPNGIGQVLFSTLTFLLVFDICKKIQNDKIHMLIDFINPHTFYIFLYHILIINIMQFIVYPNFVLSIKIQFLLTSSVVLFSILIYCLIMNRLKNAY